MLVTLEVAEEIIAKFLSLKVKKYEDLKGTGIKELFGTLWTPIKDNNYGTAYEQWEPIPPFRQSLDELVPVWEKLKFDDCSDVFSRMRMFSFKPSAFDKLGQKTIQEVACVATAHAILKNTAEEDNESCN